MLPERRQEEGLYSIPQLTIETGDIDGFMDELSGFHSVFRGCFLREGTHENFSRYMVGHFSTLERKSIEPIALHVEGAKVRTMQDAITEAHWDEGLMLRKYHELLREDMGEDAGILVFDETGFVKKGEESAGVAKQYCGSIGKVENCQVGVFAGYASGQGYAFLDKRLYIPEEWFDKDHEKKREKDAFPKGLGFRTKPQLAAEMFEGIAEECIVPFKYVVADSVYGESEDFLHAVESHVGVTYLVGIRYNMLCWPDKGPATEMKASRRGKESQARKVVAEDEKKPIRVDEFAHKLNDFFWYRRLISEGTKGPIEYEFTKRRVTLCKEGFPTRTVWLVIKRSIDKKNYWYSISNAPFSTQLPTFVWLSGSRWAIEQCFEEAKDELGMDQYEMRKYPGWNRHILTVMLAHFFLWHIMIRLGKKSSAHYTLPDETTPWNCLAYENLR